MSSSAVIQPFPAPVFEGSEKRIEIDFAHAPGAVAALDGLRSVTRDGLDAVLDLAACCIVSARHGADFDSYVLSESSLFVYPRKVRFLWGRDCRLCCRYISCAVCPSMMSLASNVNISMPQLHCRVPLSVRPDLALGVNECSVAPHGFAPGV